MTKPTKTNPIIAVEGASVEIQAAAGDKDDRKLAEFSVLAYTGTPIMVGGYDLPTVIDLAGLESGRSLVANLDHDGTKRVGNVTARSDEGGELRLSGVASAATAARDEVVASARDGFVWQASVEVSPSRIEEMSAGETATVNGREVTGPAYIVRAGRLKGFAFVSHGADDNTTVHIAATAGDTQPKEGAMTLKPEVKAWIEEMGFNAEELTEQQLKSFEANFEGRSYKPKPQPATSLDDKFAEIKARQQRESEIAAIVDNVLASRGYHDEEFVEAVQQRATAAVAAGKSPEEFKAEMFEATLPTLTVHSPGIRKRDNFDGRAIEAAICRAGGLPSELVEKSYNEQTLEAADKHFPNGLGPKELLLLAARANGYMSTSMTVNRDVMKAAFADVRASSGFSTLSVPGILSNIANKFLWQGWMSVDSTWRRISSQRSVRDFKTVTSYSLTGGFEYSKVGPGGELKHATVGETSYTNQADTYGAMFGITRQDIVNDDLDALTAVPRRLGRGAALKINNVFWTEFLDNSTFFSSGNNNVSTGAGSALDIDGLSAADVVFMNQTDPDGHPLGLMPAILLVPPTLKSQAMTLMNSQAIIDGTSTDTQGSVNIWQGRYRVESAPYMENTSYTGYSTSAWYLLADPNDMPVIEVAFLNGRDAPVVETADADFNTLGVQMRGYHDFGVAKYEYRGGVRSAGS